MKYLIFALVVILAPVMSFAQKPSSAPPAPLVNTSLTATYQSASDAFYRAQAGTESQIFGSWKAIFIAPIDSIWNNARQLPASYDDNGVPSQSTPFTLDFGNFISGGNDFLEVPAVSGSAAKFNAQGPNKVFYTSEGACFATYSYGNTLSKNSYYDHECRLLTPAKLICALTFRSENPLQVGAPDAAYLNYIVGYIGYIKK